MPQPLDPSSARPFTPAELAAKRLARAQQRLPPAAATPLPAEHEEPVPVYAAKAPAKIKPPSRTYVVHTKLTDGFGWRLARLTQHIRQTTRRRSGDNVTIELAIQALEDKLGLPPIAAAQP